MAAINEPRNIVGLWHLVGIASRIAIALGINRKDEVYLASWLKSKESEGREGGAGIHRRRSSIYDPAMRTLNQRRKALFWSFYALDRLAMYTMGRPAAIRDEDIDVDVSQGEV